MNNTNQGNSEELDFGLSFAEESQHQPLGHADIRPDDCSPYYPFGIGQMQALSFHPVDLQQSGLQPSLTHPQSLGLYHTGYGASGSVQNPMESPSRVFDCPSIQITSSPANCHQDLGVHQQEACPAGAEGNGGSALAKDQLYLSLEAPYRDTSSLSPCSPCSSLSSRSWFSDASSCESFSHVYDDVEAELNEAAARVRLVSPYVSPLGSPLPSPLASPQASPQVSPIVSPFGSPSYAQQATYGEDPWYRFQQQQQQQQQHALFAQSLSPHQSPYQSPRTSVTEETWLNPRTHSSSSRPSSRPTSPCGKRRHSSAEVMLGSSSPHLSPVPTPTHSPQGSFTEESWMSNPTSIFAPFQPCASETDVPVKTRRTYQPYQNQNFTPLLPGQADLAQEDHGVGSAAAPLDTALEGSLAGIKKEDVVEHFLSVPTHFSWTKPKQVHNPIYRASALPSLDCLLPSQFGQCELHIEVQPKPHHRAHYETEGSRGAIKSPSGGHPMVKLIGYNEKPVNLQLFIGTADERHVRPHAFYQVHRITGKTVTTASQEMIIASTKVLEIPLLPENNMSASIDCAGILKLRNSDIELRKGETDIGRKNTRVRIVFRVHIPQANGNVLSLQTASVPIECSQRSALELPQIQKFSPVSSTVNGGEEMLITGPNINSESKVIFLEKSPDGRTQWEIDAKPVHEKCKDMSIVVKIPPYHKRVITAPAQVYFYVSNGKRKRSPAQRFTYLSVQIKQEFGQEKDLTSRDPLDSQSTHSLHGHYAAEFQSLSDQNLPLEQWLFDGGPGFGASSAQLSYSPVSSSPLNQPVLPGRDFNAGPALYHTLNPRAVESIKPSYLDSQPKSHHNGGPSLPVNSASLQNPKSMSFPSGEAVSRPDVSYNGSPVVLSGSFSSSSGGLQINRESVHKHSRDFQVPPGSGSEHQLQSHQDLHGTRHKPSTAAPFLPVDPGKFPQPSSSAQVPPLSHQSPARESPSASSPAGGGLVDLQLTRSPPVQAAGTSIASLSPETSLDQSLEAKKLDIKQEPDEDKELAFQSIGLQDITLDDVSEIIVRDLFQSPDPHDSAEGQSKP